MGARAAGVWIIKVRLHRVVIKGKKTGADIKLQGTGVEETDNKMLAEVSRAIPMEEDRGLRVTKDERETVTTRGVVNETGVEMAVVDKELVPTHSPGDQM